MCVCAAAAAKSLQSCLTLCDPIDSSPPGSSVRRILQARILECGLPFPSPGDLLHPGIEPRSPVILFFFKGFWDTASLGSTEASFLHHICRKYYHGLCLPVLSDRVAGITNAGGLNFRKGQDLLEPVPVGRNAEFSQEAGEPVTGFFFLSGCWHFPGAAEQRRLSAGQQLGKEPIRGHLLGSCAYSLCLPGRVYGWKMELFRESQC